MSSNAIQLRTSPINSRSWRRAAGQRVNIKTVNIHDCSRFVHGHNSAVPRRTALPVKMFTIVHDLFTLFLSVPIRIMSCRFAQLHLNPCHVMPIRVNFMSIRAMSCHVMHVNRSTSCQSVSCSRRTVPFLAERQRLRYVSKNMHR